MSTVKSQTFIATNAEVSAASYVLKQLTLQEPFLVGNILSFCFVHVVDPVTTVGVLQQQAQRQMIRLQSSRKKRRSSKKKGRAKSAELDGSHAVEVETEQWNPPLIPQELLLVPSEVLSTKQRLLVVSTSHVSLFNVIQLQQQSFSETKPSKSYYIELTTFIPFNIISQCSLPDAGENPTADVLKRTVRLVSDVGTLDFITSDMETAASVIATICSGMGSGTSAAPTSS